MGPNAAAWAALVVTIHLITEFLWYPALILLIGQARQVLLRPAVRLWLDRVTATELIGLGLRLAAEARR